VKKQQLVTGPNPCAVALLRRRKTQWISQKQAHKDINKKVEDNPLQHQYRTLKHKKGGTLPMTKRPN